MLQFIFGVFVGSIIGIFIMAVIFVGKTGEQNVPSEKSNSTEIDADA